MVARCEILNQGSYCDRTWIAMMVISAFCHALFFSGIIVWPQLRFTNTYTPTAVEVDLVSLPAPSTHPQRLTDKTKTAKQVAEKLPQQPEKIEAIKTLDKPEPVKSQKKEAVSLSPQKPLQVKRSLKKKTYNVSNVIDKAIAEIEKKAPESRPHSVLQAIERLKQEGHVADHRTRSSGVSTTAGGLDKKRFELLDIYNAEIWHQIQKNWAFSEQIAQSNTDLEGIIIMKIMRDGEIRDIWFEKRSGNSYFDDSVLKAVKKSNPLPPLPDGFLGPYYDVGIRFNPSELRRRP